MKFTDQERKAIATSMIGKHDPKFIAGFIAGTEFMIELINNKMEQKK